MKVLKQYIERRKLSIKLKNIKGKIILLQTPEHGNLGDQLIAIALREYLEKRYSKENIFELSYKKSRYCLDILENNINEEDIIFFMEEEILGIYMLEKSNLEERLYQNLERIK